MERRITPGAGSRLAGPAAALLALGGCATGPALDHQPLQVPADGWLHVTTEQVGIAVEVPAPVRGQPHRVHEGEYYFLGERAPDYHLMAFLDIWTVDPSGRTATETSLAAMGDRQVLDSYLASAEPEERSKPGRASNVLRSYEHVGGARPAQAAQGAVCDERALVAEDREVPGQGGRPFLYHARYYTCIHPRSHLPVELGWTERYPADGGELSPAFETEASGYFESLRFE